MYFSASSLNFSEALPFGASVATTWLNLMTMGACAVAEGIPVAAAAASALEPLSTSRLFILRPPYSLTRFHFACPSGRHVVAGYSDLRQP